MGRHDPHPSNPYYKYLRVDTNKGAKMDNFCAACHPIKADDAASGRGKFNFYTSMDETGNRVMKAAGAAAKPAAAQKK